MITKINNYYVAESPDNFVVTIGEIDGAVFTPSLEINKWGGECRFKMDYDPGGTITYEDDNEIIYEKSGKRVKFKTFEKEKVKDGIDYLDLGLVAPKIIPAEYELSELMELEKITVMTYYPAPGIFLFGEQPADKYLDLSKVDIPLVRASSHSTNPSYGDEGIVVIDIHVPDIDDMQKTVLGWQQAVMEVFAVNGVPTYENNGKIYYSFGKKNYKLSSPEARWHNMWTYINIECDYTKVFDYYKTSASGEASPGIKTHYPGIDKWIVADVVERFAVLMGENLDPLDWEQEDADALDARGDMLALDDDWVLSGIRDDGMGIVENEDRFHFDMEFDSKPESNVISFPIYTENLVFHKQPPLTEEEKEQSCYRPPNVVNSYAVYFANKKTAYANTDEAAAYTTGKAFHIYRPAVIDADGNKIWADMDIDTESLIVTIDQDFLDIASYPITLDPTFGYTSVGASGVNPGNRMSATQVAVPKSGIATTVHAHCNDTGVGAPQDSKCALYDNTDGNSLLQQTNEVAFGGTGWKTYTLASPTLVPTHEIAIVLHARTAQYQNAINYDSSTLGDGSYQTRSYADGFPDPHTLIDEARIYSIYCSYQYAGRMQTKGENMAVKGENVQIKG